MFQPELGTSSELLPLPSLHTETLTKTFWFSPDLTLSISVLRADTWIKTAVSTSFHGCLRGALSISDGQDWVIPLMRSLEWFLFALWHNAKSLMQLIASCKIWPLPISPVSFLIICCSTLVLAVRCLNVLRSFPVQNLHTCSFLLGKFFSTLLAGSLT